MRFPITMGLSGKAAFKKQIIIAKSGDKEKYYSSEIDNLHNVHKIDNMILGPIHDT